MKCPFCIKICSTCKKILVANTINFTKAKSGKYGLCAKCKICKNEQKRKYYNENKELVLKQNKKWCDNNREKVLENKRLYGQTHKEQRRQYYNNNKDRINKIKREYRRKNPQTIINSNIKRRLKENQQGSGFTKEQWLEMMNFFDWKCAYSDKSLNGNSTNRTIDHIVPLKKDGQHEIWNLVPMYREYNTYKRDKDMLDWYKQQEFYSEERLNKIYEWQKYAYEKWSKEKEDTVNE